MSKIIKIANGQGFWGDSVDAPFDLINNADIDYLTLDYLAEVTMAIMQKQYNKSKDRGYANDFVDFVEKSMGVIISKNLRIITNAGGVNPYKCAEEIKKRTTNKIKIAVVEGDNIVDKINGYIEKGVSFNNIDNGKRIEEIKDSICSANIYIDSFIVAEALKSQPHIVLGGRITDPGLIVGPCIYEFAWRREEYKKLAAATVAGHIIECGAQCTGGNYSRWWENDNFTNIGYPIISINQDGLFDVYKDKGTGGLVNKLTVTEQLLYEMGNPREYLSPDVTVDFTSIKLNDREDGTVSVSNVEGSKPTDTFKVAVNYISGYKANGKLTVTAPYAIEKAKKISEIILDRLKRKGIVFDEHRVDFIGYNSCSAATLEVDKNPNELTMSISVKDQSKSKIETFSKELAPLITNGPPGITGFSGGRPKVQEVISYWPTLISKSMVETKIKVY
jgi:hypothetical protein